MSVLVHCNLSGGKLVAALPSLAHPGKHRCTGCGRIVAVVT